MNSDRPLSYNIDSNRLLPNNTVDSSLNRSVKVRDIGQILRDLVRIWMRDLERTPAEVANFLNLPVRDIRSLLRTGRCDVCVLERVMAVSDMTLQEIFEMPPDVIDSPAIDQRQALAKLVTTRATMSELRMVWEFIQITREMPALRELANTSGAAFMEVARGLGYKKERGREYLENTLGFDDEC